MIGKQFAFRDSAMVWIFDKGQLDHPAMYMQYRMAQSEGSAVYLVNEEIFNQFLQAREQNPLILIAGFMEGRKQREAE